MDQRVRRGVPNSEHGPHLRAHPSLSDLSKDANPFILDTDVSGHAIGTVSAQADRDGRERVIQYGSRTLNKAERNYSATRREMLALVAFTRKFAVYLKGKAFVVRTYEFTVRLPK